MLQDEDSPEYVRDPERLGKSPICEVSQITESVTKIKRQGLRIGTWNFQGYVVTGKN